jgi:hypothetical protein
VYLRVQLSSILTCITQQGQCQLQRPGKKGIWKVIFIGWRCGSLLVSGRSPTRSVVVSTPATWHRVLRHFVRLDMKRDKYRMHSCAFGRTLVVVTEGTANSMAA